jgi:ubiquinone/menaquinone biosynthesis C-methylase UbiE
MKGRRLQMEAQPNHPEIYRSQAQQYDALVRHEDGDGNIVRALTALCPWSGRTVVETGAGTGRLTFLLAGLTSAYMICDHSPAMLAVAAEKQAAGGFEQVRIAAADHRRLPLAGGQADICLSGWSVCYLVVDHPLDWQAHLAAALGELERLLKPGGWTILLETLGTGFKTPHAPEHLQAYYHYLETHGFRSQWIRTDYQFESLAQGQELARFFFGEAMVAKVVPSGHGARLAECTGIWARQKVNSI